MKCNVSQQVGKQKPNKFALIKNKKKIERVAHLGMLYDKLEAEYNRMPEDSPARSEKKAQMDEVAEQIKTLSAEIKSEVYKGSSKASDGTVASGSNSTEESVDQKTEEAV